MFPGKISLANKLRLAFLPISIILSLWVSSLAPVTIAYFLFQELDFIVFVFLLPPLLLLGYAVFTLALLIMFRISMEFYPRVPDGTYTINDYEYYRNGARQFYYRIYLGFLPGIFTCFPQLYRFFGAKIGKGNYIGGIILDPSRLEIGDRTFIGKDANISGHVFQDNKLTLKKISIKNDVTIGGGSLIFPGATIENKSVIGALTVVPMNKKIPPNTVWVGSKPQKINKSKK